MNVNFSIPVKLFDYRESENSLYSYAKLKIFYVGMTGDKRLFTKEFSDQLIDSLPYVPVVGYYDEEEEDFKGHNPKVQHIYGVVPIDTRTEYFIEDGKEYAVCDVILYTGRNDRTGEIAQKIIGKQHSLELDPNTTTYEINKNEDGKIESIEFKTGSLLGLSILGDNERPAFTGSGFFKEDTELMKLFESFRVELEKFIETNRQRGEIMSRETIDVTLLPEEKINEETISFTSVGEDNSGLVVDEEATVEKEVLEEKIETETEEEVFEEKTQTEEEVEIEEEQIPSREERFIDAFIKRTEDEIQEDFLNKFYQEFGENVAVIQWSLEDGIVIYIDFSDWKYYRVDFEETEEGITFSDKILVKPRYLTEDEINQVFIETEETGTDEFETVEEGEIDNEEIAEEEVEEQEELNSTALNNSEREELEAFRAEKKKGLVNSFSDDLDKAFLAELIKNINEYSFDDLEIILSKEFTRVSRQDRNITKPSTFVYVGDNRGTTTEEELVKRLVDQYKTKK